MEWLLLLIGILLLAAAALDSLWTTLWVDGGAGPLSRRILDLVQRAAALLGRGRHRALSVAGPLSMVTMVAMWVFLVWAGWTFVFLSEPDAVVAAETGRNAGLTDRIYYAAFTLFTLGNGDFVPSGGVWQILAGLAALNGLALVTIGLTYIITVLTAVVERRAVAAQLLALAEDPQDVVLRAWTRGRFEGLDQMLGSMTTTIARTAERHLAYPVLHTYHADRPNKSLSVAITVLDEALTIIRFGVKEDVRPGGMALEMARGTIEAYLDTLRSQDRTIADEVPPVPALDRVRAAGIPVVDDAAFRRSVEGLSERRRLLLGNLRAEHWEWDAASKAGRRASVS